ncbi:MAG: hypothetical protein KJZ84_21895 [Bryobacteraceae bacterium]|nr:hypothetical protein [Bryobacteraceae bacterium]
MRYHHFLKIEGEAFDSADLSAYPVPLFDHLRRTIEGLKRSYLRTLKALEDRRRHNPQLAQPSKIIVEWIDPRTGEPWRPKKPDEEESEETNPTPTPETEETNPSLARQGEVVPTPDPETEQTNPTPGTNSSETNPPTQSSAELRPYLCRP